MVVCMSVLLLCFNQCSCCVSVNAVAVFQSVLLLCFNQCSCCVSVSAVAVFQSVLFEAMVKNLALHDELGRPRKKELIVKVWNQKTNKVRPKVIAVVLVCLSVHLSAAIAVASPAFFCRHVAPSTLLYVRVFVSAVGGCGKPFSLSLL